ncbi:MAG TPA: hypothetical protein VF171_02145 [Trueperaceae bacterium]
MTSNSIVRLAFEHQQQLLAEAEAARTARLAPTEQAPRRHPISRLTLPFRRPAARQATCLTC